MSALRSSPVRKLVAPSSLILLAACAAMTQSRSPLRDHMEFHFSEIHKVQSAVIQGNLGGVRVPAEAISLQADHPDMPRGVNSPVDDLRRYARETAASGTLADAARNTARMATACGRCHAAGGGGPVLRTEFPPPGQGQHERMRRHEWAADRMWDALIANNTDVWRAGASALVDAAMVPEGDPDPDLRALARQVNDLGREAARVDVLDARAGLFGRMLTTCAACHKRLQETQR